MTQGNCQPSPSLGYRLAKFGKNPLATASEIKAVAAVSFGIYGCGNYFLNNMKQLIGRDRFFNNPIDTRNP